MSKEINNIKILIIEDDEDITFMIERVLKNIGFKIYKSSDGFDGLDKIKKIVPDLILLDIMMPNLDGYGFMKKVKDLKIYDTIPIILISALDKAENIEKAKILGAIEYIKKPIDINLVKEKIMSVLQITNTLQTNSRAKQMSFFIRNEGDILVIKLVDYVNKIDLLDLIDRVKERIKPDQEDNKVVIDFQDILNDSLDEILLDYTFKFYNINLFSAKNIKIVTDNEKVKVSIRNHLIAKNFEIVRDFAQGILKIRIGA